MAEEGGGALAAVVAGAADDDDGAGEGGGEGGEGLGREVRERAGGGDEPRVLGADGFRADVEEGGAPGGADELGEAVTGDGVGRGHGSI